MSGESRSDARLEHSIAWLNNLIPLTGVIHKKQPFIRTKFLNDKRGGCYMCSRKGVTKHHIKRGHAPLVVYLCWKHHQIIHGTALTRFSLGDLRTVLTMADEYSLWKEEEVTLVKKKIITEIEHRNQKI